MAAEVDKKKAHVCFIIPLHETMTSEQNVKNLWQDHTDVTRDTIATMEPRSKR